MYSGARQCTMVDMLMTGSGPIDAERAFTRATRARRRGALVRRLRGEPAECGRLPVVDERSLQRSGGGLARGVREIPLSAIRGTLEPSRAALFDGCFRPTRAARARWQRLWLAEHRGSTLPPIAVVQVGDTYVVRDGHHRISVAKARGALTIDATVGASEA